MHFHFMELESGIGKSNPFLYLGKVALGRLTNPAFVILDYTTRDLYKKDLTEALLRVDLIAVPTERRNGMLVQRSTRWGWFTRADFRIRQETGLVPTGLIDAVTGNQVHVLLDRGQLADMAQTGLPPEGYNLPRQRENVS